MDAKSDDTHTHTHTHKTDRQADRQTDKQIDKQTHSQTHTNCVHSSCMCWLHSPTTKKRKINMATPAMMTEGTIKLSPQGGLGQLLVALAQKEGITVPRIFPREVWAFQIPIIRPRLKKKNYLKL